MYVHPRFRPTRSTTDSPVAAAVVSPAPPPPLPLPLLGRELASPPSDGISNLRFSIYSDHLLVSSWDAKVRLYDASANVLKSQFAHRLLVLDCCFHDDSSGFTASADHTVYRYDFNTGGEDRLGTHDAPVRCVDYSHATVNDSVTNVPWTCSECRRLCWAVSTAESILVELESLCAEMEDPIVTVKEVEDEWQVVRPRKGKPHTKRLSHRSVEDRHLSCCPGHGPNSNLSSRAVDEEQRLRAKLQKSLERVRSSVFFKNLVEQMQCLQILEKLLANARRSASLQHGHSVTKGDFAAVPIIRPNSIEHEACTFHFSDGSLIIESAEHKMKENQAGETRPATKSLTVVELVVLGVGSILDSEVSRCQMCVALLLKDRFSCIGNILVYDPVLSEMECGFLTNLGCTPIVRDEKGRRRALAPTLFYMPHCGASLYNNLLEENLDPWCLGWISILGNSFQKYQDSWSVCPKPKHARPDYLLGMQKHVTEHPVNAASFPNLSAFNDMSWHLFPIDKIL